MGMNKAYMSIGNVLEPLLAGLLFDVHFCIHSSLD